MLTYIVIELQLHLVTINIFFFLASSRKGLGTPGLGNCASLARCDMKYSLQHQQELGSHLFEIKKKAEWGGCYGGFAFNNKS